MISLGNDFRIDDVLTFYAQTSDPTSGGELDADSVPTYRLYENETGTPILTGSMAKLDDSNTTGFYSEAITLSAANGFEAGKAYCIRIAGVVSVGSPATTGADLQVFRMMRTIAEPSGVFAWPGTPDAILGWLGAAATNAYEETASAATFRNRADSADLATATLSDDTTTFERGPVT